MINIHDIPNTNLYDGSKPESMMRIKLEFLGLMTFDTTIVKHHGSERENQAHREAYAI